MAAYVKRAIKINYRQLYTGMMAEYRETNPQPLVD